MTRISGGCHGGITVNQIQATKREPQNPAVVLLATATNENTRRAMQTSLRIILAAGYNMPLDSVPQGHEFLFEWWQLNAQDTQAVKASLVKAGYATSTVNRHLSVLRNILKQCWRLGLMEYDEYSRASDISNVKGERLPAGRDVSEDELRALLLTCDDGLIGLRDLAMIGVMASTGIRRSEVSGLLLEDYDEDTGLLRIHGKGNKHRTVYVLNRARDFLHFWLDHRGSWPGPLFCSIRKGGKLSNSPYPSSSIHEMLKDRSERAGIETVKPHDLRRSFVGRMLDAGADMSVLAKITGHSDLATLSRYDRRKEKAKRDASLLIDLPE
jgi:site-specific recombinase XerD